MWFYFQDTYKCILFSGKCPTPESTDRPEVNISEISVVSEPSIANVSDNNGSLQESSITGHLQRCFNDSSQSSILPDKNKVISFFCIFTGYAFNTVPISNKGSSWET